ncbi:MAG: hypothetical protein FJ051_07065, partial [Cyanobacteria bacterium M_surface_9_m1_291]|nr:hypothetical protein [Cyanobacteria bacterium M_surface_9_m1_291]
MSTRVAVVLKQREQLEQLQALLSQTTPALAQLVCIGDGETPLESVDALNPASKRKLRQRRMALWLIPFGFVAGLT